MGVGTLICDSRMNTDQEFHGIGQLLVIESLEKYKPRHLYNILCSWMPPGQDWMAEFRWPSNAINATSYVPLMKERLLEECILIDKADDDTCGHKWHMWGILDSRDDVVNGDSDSAPFAMDGYVQADLDILLVMQFPRFTCKRSRESMTVSFRLHTFQVRKHELRSSHKPNTALDFGTSLVTMASRTQQTAMVRESVAFGSCDSSICLDVLMHCH